MQPLEYNLVDAYNRELEAWWYELPPSMERFVNVVLPQFLPEVKDCLNTYFEDNSSLEIRLKME